jgi:hypothetical protein
MNRLTHVKLFEAANLPRTRGPIGQRYFGTVFALIQDILAEGASTAERAARLYDIAPVPPDEQFEAPLDAIDQLGRDCLLVKYAPESYAHLLAVVRNKWVFWTGSPKQGLIDELERAGYEGVEIKVPRDYADPTVSDDYWSRFWIDMPLGTHIVTGPAGFVVGTGVVGTDRIGPGGLDTEEGARWYGQLKSVTRKMKPVDWIVWDYRFEISPGSWIVVLGKKRFNDPNYEYEFTP